MGSSETLGKSAKSHMLLFPNCSVAVTNDLLLRGMTRVKDHVSAQHRGWNIADYKI